MKRMILAAVLLVTATACTQKTETTTSVDTAGQQTSTSTTTVTATMPAIDTPATAQAKQDVKDAGTAIKNAAPDAAHATGTAMETAGKAIQKKTKRY